MEEINHRRLSYAWHHDAFCQTLAAQVALIHCRQVLEENQIAIRFENGYGVTILPVSLEEEVFEMLVLRFYGTGINDYQVAANFEPPSLTKFQACDRKCPFAATRKGGSGTRAPLAHPAPGSTQPPLRPEPEGWNTIKRELDGVRDGR